MFPNNLEYDLETGQRGNPRSHVESLICRAHRQRSRHGGQQQCGGGRTGAGNNSPGLEVPVSRGELVEIGGSFRVPEVMESSACTLVEVGATNRTHLKDYRSAISGETALLMKVHTSNYRLQGFTQSVDEKPSLNGA